MSDENNVHVNHRQRMKQKFENNGFENFNEHEKLEFLLYFSVPRRNTNKEAHLLIEKFGSLSRVFTASEEELEAVEGIGRQSALLIKTVNGIVKACSEESVSAVKTIKSYDDGGKYFTALFKGLSYERIILLCLDANKRIIDTVTLCEGSCNMVNVNMKRLVAAAIRSNASGVILAHNHPSGNALPSGDDLNTTSLVRKTLSVLDISLIEHYIIADDNYMGILQVSDSK